MAPSLMWFRRDLRVADNPALAAAAAGGPVVPLFVLDPSLIARSGANRVKFLLASLRALDESMGGALIVRAGDPRVIVPTVAAEARAHSVHVTGDCTPYGRRRDLAVAAALATDGRALSPEGSPYAVAPGTVRNNDGRPYSVFSPFSRSWERVGWGAAAGEHAVSWAGREIVSDPLPAEPSTAASLPDAGEAAAHERADAFFATAVDHYARDRDLPGLAGTSRLSVDLRWGAIHPRQLLARLAPQPSHDMFRSELCWREFYADVLLRRPDSAWESYQPSMTRLPVDTDAAARARFARWARGRTGYPIVDAGMRQLVATGWMHNRVRMITASFLVKDLHLPWQWGARHFMDHLVDGDLASNSHGWQWAAGTGTDAAPYFRIFNPVTQGDRYDPEGSYVRTWVPELADVPDRHVHAPWRSPGGPPVGYVSPMVDHALEREEALRRYALVKGR